MREYPPPEVGINLNEWRTGMGCWVNQTVLNAIIIATAPESRLRNVCNIRRMVKCEMGSRKVSKFCSKFITLASHKHATDYPWGLVSPVLLKFMRSRYGIAFRTPIADPWIWYRCDIEPNHKSGPNQSSRRYYYGNASRYAGKVLNAIAIVTLNFVIDLRWLSPAGKYRVVPIFDNSRSI